MWLKPSGRIASLLVLVGIGLPAAGAPLKPAEKPPTATSASQMAEADKIWRYEQEIYRRRGAGDLSYYVSKSDPDYSVWAPKWEKPNGYAELVKAAEDLRGKTAGEVILPERKLIKINREGNVALVFYSTHRTHAPGGKPADERFDTLHVWTKGPNGWRLMGGMARPAG